MKVAYHNLGCKVNYYELQAVKDIMQNAGYETVDFDEVADVYVINTCSVTNVADQKSRQMISRARQRSKKAIVIAMGCYVQSTIKDNSLIAADIIIGNNRKHNIVKDIERFIEDKSVIIDVEDINDKDVSYEDMDVIKESDHTRAFIKIQDGCNEFCTYCIIPYMRGRVRSRDYDSILGEINNLAERGYKEFVLTGIHISSYCYKADDTSMPMYLIDIIEAIAKIDTVERVRLGSLEPRIISEDFVKRIAVIDKVCPHFHLSLQSGADSVLKRMNRKYTTEEFYECCKLLRKYYNEPAITTDIIVGFPGETKEEFDNTYDFLNKIHFSEMHIFKYSRRYGTKADRMIDQVKAEIKKERSNKLIELSKEMNREYIFGYLEKDVSVLFEEVVMINGLRYYQGYTMQYIKALIKTDDNLSNQIIHCRAKDIMNNALLVEKI